MTGYRVSVTLQIQYEKQHDVNLLSNAPGYPKEHCFSQASPDCPSGIKVKMGMQHWWNDTDRRNPTYSEEKPVSLPFIVSFLSIQKSVSHVVGVH